MKRLGMNFLLLLAVLGLALPLSSTAVAQADVNSFTVQNYEIDYYLDRDGEGRSTLKTVESITALFPATDQNHGIERVIPNEFDGHSTNLKIQSVTDANNKPYGYTTYGSNGNTVIRIGDAEMYVHGPVAYKITYTQRDVTRYFADTNKDEFYWDTNGTQWGAPITNLAVRLHVSESLRSARAGDTACYVGVTGSEEKCTLNTTDGLYTTTAQNLQPYQNVTIAVGFKPNTFKPYQATLTEKLIMLFVLVTLLTTPIAIGLTIWFLVRFYRRSNRLAELDPVVPEYLPPPDTSVSTAAAISRKPGRSFSAQLIGFAVRDYLRIYETRQKSLFQKANYELEIIKDIRDLKPEEQELLKDIFSSTQIGTKLDMASMKKDYSLATKLQDNSGKLSKSIATTYALRGRNDQQSGWFKRAGFVTLIASAVTLSPALFIAAIVSFICGAMLKPLTDKGLALARYLRGLELYIGVAETDRLRMLQSPEGATKIGDKVDTNDAKQLIKLYERVLPYAILFGQEKEWNKRLANYYQTANTSPSWYAGNSATFNAAVFSSAINNFTSTATYSSPSNSSSGGSSGGGSSGGGGGGGGGGGW